MSEVGIATKDKDVTFCRGVFVSCGERGEEYNKKAEKRFEAAYLA